MAQTDFVQLGEVRTFFHPDYTVGSGIAPDRAIQYIVVSGLAPVAHTVRAANTGGTPVRDGKGPDHGVLSGSRALPPIGSWGQRAIRLSVGMSADTLTLPRRL
jgi:hypothetical protein